MTLRRNSTLEELELLLTGDRLTEHSCEAVRNHSAGGADPAVLQARAQRPQHVV